MTLSVPDSYYAVGILDAAQRDQAAELAAACVAHIDAGRWGNATAARSILFDYIDSANGGKKTAPNVDNFMFYGDYNETAVFRFLNSDPTKKLLNLPANASWQQSSDAVHDHLSDDIMKPYDHMINPILDAGLPTLLYQGQLDMRDGVAATEAWLANWTWMRGSGVLERGSLGCVGRHDEAIVLEREIFARYVAIRGVSRGGAAGRDPDHGGAAGRDPDRSRRDHGGAAGRDPGSPGTKWAGRTPRGRRGSRPRAPSSRTRRRAEDLARRRGLCSALREDGTGAPTTSQNQQKRPSRRSRAGTTRRSPRSRATSGAARASRT